MSSAKTVKREVRFFKLAAMLGGKEVVLQEPDWAAVWKAYATRSPKSRTFLHNRNEYLIEGRGTGDTHLAIHKKKQVGDMMTRLTDDDGTVTEVLAVDKKGAFADSALVSFVQGTSVFAIVSRNGGSGAPRAGLVSALLNELRPFGQNHRFMCEPLRQQPNLEGLATAAGARRVKMKFPIGSLAAGSSDLGSALRDLTGNLTAGTITVEIGMGRSTPSQRDRREMLALAQDLAESLPEGASADASILHERPKTKKRPDPGFAAEVIDLVEHSLAQPIELAVRSGEISIDATFQAVENVIDQHRHHFV